MATDPCVSDNPTWMQSCPTGPLLALEETGGHSSSPCSVVWEGAASSILHPSPHLPPLSVAEGLVWGQPPTSGEALPGRRAGSWNVASGWGGAWISQDQRPQVGREPVLLHLVSCAGSCSELGADSASQDTSLQSACEGGPCRPGPLHPLPWASPGPPQPHPGVPPGPSPWTPCPFTWPDNLVVLAAVGSSPPRRTTRPRAESRGDRGATAPLPSLPL